MLEPLSSVCCLQEPFYVLGEHMFPAIYYMYVICIALAHYDKTMKKSVILR